MKIQEIANKLNITILQPVGHTLSSELVNNTNSGHNGTILFNLKPLNHLNVVHFAIFSYLKIFSENNFRCTIILQDLITINGDFINEINTSEEANSAMDLFFKRMKSFVTDLKNIEVIPESTLLRLYNRGQRRFFFDLIRLSSVADKLLTNDTPIKKSFDHIDSLCCLLYESFIQPSYIVTGGSELETVWHQLRNRGNLTPIFGDAYRPPISLILPPIKKHDEDVLISSLDTNDPFCETFNIPPGFVVQDHYKAKIKDLNAHVNLIVTDEAVTIINTFKNKVYNASSR